jgi:UDP-glucose 4-epimerase
MKLLITGGCGYVGSELIKSLLKSDHKIINIDTQWFGNYLSSNKNLINAQDMLIKLYNFYNDNNDIINPILKFLHNHLYENDPSCPEFGKIDLYKS